MSQLSGPPERTGRPGRYVRSSGGLLGALIVSVVLVGSFVGVRSLFLPDRPDGPPAVEWQPQARAARVDGVLTIPAPARLPSGWAPTSAIYTGNPEPAWQLGLLTGDEKFVGVYERVDDVDDLVEEHVDENAQRGDDVELGGETWQVWTDSGGDYALAREVDEPVGEQGTILVVGSAPDDVVRDFAASLEYAGPSDAER